MLTDVVIANKNYTKLSVSENQTVDWIALKVMKQDCPDFLLPIKTMEIDGEQEIRYEQQDGVRLCYSSRKMYKKDFVALLENMLMPFKICNDWFLDYHNILLDEKYVLLGKKDNTVKYIYIPVAEYAQTDEEIENFFSSVILEADIMDDSRYAVDLLRILKNSNSNLMTVLDFLSKGAADLQNEQDEGMRRGGSMQRGTSGAAGGRAEAPRGDYSSDFNRTEEPGARGSIWDAGGKTQNDQSKEKKSGMTNASEYEGEKRGSGGARPGQPGGEFGKTNAEKELLGSLFGEEEEDEDEKKSPKGKAGKHPKEKEKAKEKEKPAKGGGLFGSWKKPKDKAEEAQASSATGRQVTGGARAASGTEGAGRGEGDWRSQQGQTPYSGYVQDDVTDIAGGMEARDDGVLRLRLIDSAGYDCPRMVEIDMSRGYATVGRLDKNGQAQSDYCFDAVLSFISRRHFRVEKNGDHWMIIDIGSGNGTYVNGERLVANIGRPLFSGDTIMFSDRILLTYQVC